MTLDATLAEYIYGHIKRCFAGSEERQMNEKKKELTKGGRNRKEKGKGEELIREKKYKDKVTFHG